MERNAIEELAERIVNGKYNKNDFNNSSLGVVLDLNSHDDYKNHIINVLCDDKTLCFTASSNENKAVNYNTIQLWKTADIFYHEPTNTMIIVPNSTNYDFDKDTIYSEPRFYRPSHGILEFSDYHIKSIDIEEREIPVVRSIYELYLGPDIENTQEPTEQKPIDSAHGEGKENKLREEPEYLQRPRDNSGLGEYMSQEEEKHAKELMKRDRENEYDYNPEIDNDHDRGIDR